MTRLANTDYLESVDFPFFVKLHQFVQGELIPPHSHEFVELVYVADGRGDHRYLDHSDQISDGDIFIIAPDSEHAYVSSSDAPLQVYNVLFDAHFFTEELTVLAKLTPFTDMFYVEPFLRARVPAHAPLKLSPLERLKVHGWLASMTQELHVRSLGYRIVIKLLLVELFVYLSRRYVGQNRSSSLASLPNEKLLPAIVAFIDQNAAQQLTLPQLCQLSGMSISTFTAKFKQFTGRTFVEYRNAKRVSLACQLLTETDEKIATIAAETGFSDLSFFNKVFRDVVGKSPGQYRASASS